MLSSFYFFIFTGNLLYLSSNFFFVFFICFRMDEKKHSGVIYCKNPNNLSYDEACLNIITRDIPVKLYYQFEECRNVSISHNYSTASFIDFPFI